MSTITLTLPLSLSRVTSESKIKKVSKSETDDFRSIIRYTVLIFGVVLTLALVGPVILSYYGGMTGLGLDMNSNCVDRIHAFEQSGYYASHEQYMAAMSYC